MPPAASREKRTRGIALLTLAACTVAVVGGLLWRTSRVEPAPAIDGPVWVSPTADSLRMGARIGENRWWVIALEENTAAPGRWNSDGLSHSEVATGSPTSGFDPKEVLLDEAQSAYEYAALIQDGDSETFVGSVHGYEEQRSLSASVDDETLGSAGATGEQATVVRKTVLRRPSTGAELATVTTTYTMTSAGLAVDWRLEWLSRVTVNTFYPAMLPVEESFARGRLGDAVVRLDRGTGGAAEGVHAPVTTASVTGSHGVTATLEVTPASVDEWRTTGPDGQTFIEDRAGNLINKIYMTRVSRSAGPVEVSAGDVWTSSAIYTVTE